MSHNEEPMSLGQKLDRSGRRGLVLGALTFGLLVLVLFGAAGRWAWTRGWAAVAVFVAGQLVNRGVLLVKHPALLNRRGRRPGQGTKSWDRRLMSLALLLVLGIPLAAGLDAGRRGQELSWTWFIIALPVFFAGVVVGVAAMLVNRHFEKTVRLQEDHRVMDGGPYRCVRHPGYVASILVFVAAPLLLGSRWALLPALAFCALFVLRTAREDRVLRAELAGYADYARKTRWRLLPGLW